MPTLPWCSVAQSQEDVFTSYSTTLRRSYAFLTHCLKLDVGGDLNGRLRTRALEGLGLRSGPPGPRPSCRNWGGCSPSLSLSFCICQMGRSTSGWFGGLNSKHHANKSYSACMVTLTRMLALHPFLHRRMPPQRTHIQLCSYLSFPLF